jgi:hypothetical protein
MAYGDKKKHSGHVPALVDLTTLLRYRQKGIKLTEEQERMVGSSGVYEQTDFEKVNTARAGAIRAMNSPEGAAAIAGGYYTEMFNHFFEQGMRCEPLTAPHPIPKAWIAIGRVIKTSEKSDYKA